MEKIKKGLYVVPSIPQGGMRGPSHMRTLVNAPSHAAKFSSDDARDEAILGALLRHCEASNEQVKELQKQG